MPYKRLALDRRDLTDRYLSGVSLLQLSKDTGVGRDTLARYLQKWGVPLRDQGSAELIKWSRMPPAQRRAQVAAAHHAAKGRRASFEELCRRSQSRDGQLKFASPTEQALVALLSARQHTPRQQHPVGPYLCDMTYGPVAVEVFGGLFHFYGRHAARAERRFMYLRDQGWHVHVVVVTVKTHPLLPAAAEDIITFVQTTRQLPPLDRQYRMIWGDGQLIATGSLHNDYGAFVETLRRGQHVSTTDYHRAT